MVCAPVVTHYLLTAESRGIDRSQLLAAAGVRERDVSPASGWVTYPVVERLLSAHLAAWPDPVLGLHFAAAMEPTVSGVVGYMTLCCPTVQDLHSTFSEFGGLVSNLFSTRLSYQPGAVLWDVEVTYRQPDIVRQSVEWFLGASALLIRRLHPDAISSVRLPHSAPQSTGALPSIYERVFACPVRFGQPQAALVLDPQALTRPSPHASPLVFDVLRSQARQLVQQLGSSDSLQHRVRDELRALLAEGRASRDSVCQRIGISTRHLHRQLQQQGSSYQQLLDDLRGEFAHERLVGPAYDPDQLSADLGFSSTKSFTRWFTGRNGITPLEFRRRKLAPAPICK